jgi:hypothetical protein
MDSLIFWDLARHSFQEYHRRFGETVSILNVKEWTKQMTSYMQLYVIIPIEYINC